MQVHEALWLLLPAESFQRPSLSRWQMPECVELSQREAVLLLKLHSARYREPASRGLFRNNSSASVANFHILQVHLYFVIFPYISLGLNRFWERKKSSLTCLHMKAETLNEIRHSRKIPSTLDEKLHFHLPLFVEISQTKRSAIRLGLIGMLHFSSCCSLPWSCKQGGSRCSGLWEEEITGWQQGTRVRSDIKPVRSQSSMGPDIGMKVRRE